MFQLFWDLSWFSVRKPGKRQDAGRSLLPAADVPCRVIRSFAKIKRGRSFLPFISVLRAYQVDPSGRRQDIRFSIGVYIFIFIRYDRLHVIHTIDQNALADVNFREIIMR